MAFVFTLFLNISAMPNFTTEDLLVYMYNEMEPPEQVTQLEAALQNDWALKQKYEVLVEAQEKLYETSLFSPRIKTINRILEYAEVNMHLSN